MRPIKQSDPRADHRRVFFTAVDPTTTPQTRLQASDMSTFTVQLAKNGVTASFGGSVVEVDSTNRKGLFYVQLALADIDTNGSIQLVIKNTGGTKAMDQREIDVEVPATFFTTVVAGLSTISFVSDRGETADNYWRDAYLVALTGVDVGQPKKIGSYVGSSKQISLVPGVQFATSPGNGDIFELITR